MKIRLGVAGSNLENVGTCARRKLEWRGSIVKDGQVPGNFAKPVREGRPSETYPITSFPWKRVRLGRATECSCKASAILRVGAEARRIYTERRELER